MESSLRHPTLSDRAEASRTLTPLGLRVARWIWPPLPPSVMASDGEFGSSAAAQSRASSIDEQQVEDPSSLDAETRNAMRWVPLVVPLAALFLVLIAGFIGSWL